MSWSPRETGECFKKEGVVSAVHPKQCFLVRFCHTLASLVNNLSMLVDPKHCLLMMIIIPNTTS